MSASPGKLNPSPTSPSSDDPDGTHSRKSDTETVHRLSGSNQLRKLVAERMRRSMRRTIKSTNLDDGYSWKKYGQKQTLGNKYPRTYFRCVTRETMGCLAAKLVQQDHCDPTTLHITYVGNHTCHQQEQQTSPSKAQEEQRHWDLQNAEALDFGNTTSDERSEITKDFTTKYEQSGCDLPSRTDVVSGRTSPTIRLEFTGQIHGMMNNKEEVISLLQSDCGREHNVSVVSIVGAEGAGKTTLARLVYDDPMICEAFELRSWICLTRVNNLQDVLRAVIKSLTTLSCHPFEQLSELQEIVKEEVTNRKYLLVLDNLWDVQILGSELFTPLRFGGVGSKILVTAKEELAIDATVWITESYKLNDMSEELCWLIVKDCAFYDTSSSTYHDIAEVARRMVPRCGGMPLAAKVIGGILRSTVYESSKSGCYVSNNDLWNTANDEKDILLAWRSSYDLLPEFLKKCLVYCSLFPKGYIFEKKYLIRLWMAQGYIEPLDYEEKEETGSEYLNELLCRSFLQRSRNPNFPKQCYEIHDHIYDLLQTFSWLEVSQTKYYNKAHILSFVSDNSSNHFEALKESPHLQCLLVDRHLLEYSGRNKVQIISSNMLSDLLDSLMHLNALDLSFSNIKELPNTIGKLMNLSYLGLTNTNIRKLPSSLCNLHNLQTLELQDCAYLHNLPEEINRLINLRHLDNRKKSGFVGIPHGLGQLTRLRTLSAFSVADENLWHSGISELKNLVNLRGDIWIGGLRNVTNEKEAEEATLGSKEGLESLTLQWSTSGRDIEDNEMDDKAIKVFENLKPHGNLKQLVVKDYSGDQFPGWIVNPSFYKLISMTLDNCRWCKKLPPLGRIASLKHLFIRRMDSVQCVGREFLGYEESVSDAFPSLETLKIWEMYNLEEWYGVKGEDFPSLRSVSISRCFKLWSLPCLPALQELTIHHGIEVPILQYLPSLTCLTIEGFRSLKTIILPPGLTSILKLVVKDCSLLSSFLGLRYSRTLREIKLDKCPILDLESDELPLILEVVDIHQTCSLLGTWCPSGFHENANFGQAIRRRLVREKQQDRPNIEKENREVSTY